MQEPTLVAMGLPETRYKAAKKWRGKMSWVELVLFFAGWYVASRLASPNVGLLLFCGFLPISIFTLLVAGPYVERTWAWLNRDYALAKAFDKAVADYKEWVLRCEKNFWLSLPGLAFEQELADLFTLAGLKARVTPASGDNGVDIVMEGGATVVQCKAHAKPIGPAVVRELHGALTHSCAKRAILASLSGFTPGVHKYVRGKPIELMDLNAIIALQRSVKLGGPTSAVASASRH